MCIKGKKNFKKKYRRKILGRTEKKKNQIAKKVEKVIPVSIGEEIPVSAREEIKKTHWFEKKTNEN